MSELKFKFKMPDDESLAEYISVKGEKGDKGDPTKLSELENDTGFVTASTDALRNYYTKSQTDDAIEAEAAAIKTELGVPAGFFTNTSNTVTGEGSLITLNDTANAVFEDVTLYGDALQQGTPTPENPVDVQVVTGEQTIIISGNGQQSQSYALMLRDLELCKLGSSQDHIYKSGGKWYKHKEVGKVVLNGSESGWSKSNATANNLYINQYIPSLAFNSVLLADKLTNRAAVQLYNNSEVGICYSTTGAGYASIRIGVSLDGAANVSDFRIWLSENPVTLYYQLAQSEDEEIADEVTIRQLEELSHSHSFDGTTTITAFGNLPVLLSVEAFKNNWIGTLSGINNQLDNTYTKSETDYLLNDVVRFIFPKFWANSRSGDCNLIKYHGKNILIDSHHVDLWSNVKAMLDDNEATHIDYFILTHYHTDHQGNIKNLVNSGYIDANTVIYMSAKVTTYGSWYSGNIAEYTGFLEEKGLSYSIPQEGEVLNIDDKLKFTFYNCDKDILEAYTSGDANSCSTCIFMEFGNTRAFYAGDAGKEVFERLSGAGLPEYTIDLYKMGHHGIDQRTHPEFIRQLSPRYAIQPSGITDFIKNNFGICEETAILRQLGTNIYACHMQPEYIVLESDGSSTQCLSGKLYSSSDQKISLAYYVDKNASSNAVQDGSENHPFSELMQAISSIPYKSGLEVTINVADGYYGNAHESEVNKNRIFISTGKDVEITINGNSSDIGGVVLNSVVAHHSNVILNNLTVDVDNWTGVVAYDSLIQLGNVNIKSYTDTLSTTNSGILLDGHSRLLTITSSPIRIEQCNECIIVRAGSTFLANSKVEIGTYNSHIMLWAESATITTGNYFTFDNDTDKLSFANYRKSIRTPVQIMATHENFAQTVSLLASAANFSWIEIFYRSSDNFYGSTGKIYSPNGKITTFFIPFANASGVMYNKQARVTISDATITIDRAYQMNLTSGNAPTVVSASSGFNIEKVVGGYDTDYVELNS